jgi:TatA/E family protein of Tat protein translocase
VFGIGMSEMIIILAVALLVFGPDKLPEIAKGISRGLKDLRRASDDLRHSVNMHIDDEEPRVRPRVRPTAGIPDLPTATEPAPNIPGSELASGLDPLPANAAPPQDASVAVQEPADVVPRAAEGAVARGRAEADPNAAPTEARANADVKGA